MRDSDTLCDLLMLTVRKNLKRHCNNGHLFELYVCNSLKKRAQEKRFESIPESSLK